MKTGLSSLLYLFEFQKARKLKKIFDKIIRKPKRYSRIPFWIAESSETQRVSDGIIRKPKKFPPIPLRILKKLLVKNQFPRIPYQFPKILIRFSTMVKRYSRIPYGHRNRYFRKPKGFQNLGNQQAILGNSLQAR